MFDLQKKRSKIQTKTKDYPIDMRRNRWRKQKLSGPSIFINKTFEILENNVYMDVITWNQEGTNFTITDVEKFQQQILPIFFRHRNFSSFVRQLNMYDFHKIRNEQNKNIFEHKQFRRDSKHLLRNIKRKGCTSKKSNENQENLTESEFMVQENQYELMEKQDSQPYLAESTDKVHSTKIIIQQPPSDSPYKNKLMDQFLSTLPQTLQTQQEIKQIIKELKKDLKFKNITSREDIRKVIKNIRRNKMRRDDSDGLEQLSIEEEIMVHNIDEQEIKNPSLAILSSQNYIPQRSISFIGSLILNEDLFQRNH